MKKTYKVQLSQYVSEYANIYVEASSVDDAALTAIEAIGWIEPEWERDNGVYPKSGTPIVIGPVLKDILEEQIYKRKE